MKLHADSLLVRLVAIQLAALIAMFATLLFVVGQSRSVAAARVIAPLWAEAVNSATGNQALSASLATPTAIKPLLGALPADAKIIRAAYFETLREEMAAFGVVISSSYTSRQRGQVSTWLEVKTATGETSWVGFQGNVFGPRQETSFGSIALVALLTVLVVTIGFTWMVVRPMHKVQGAMQTYRRNGLVSETVLGYAKSGPRETRDLAQSFVDLAKQRAQQDKDRGLMLASISHDLRTPLARIRLYADLLPESPESTETKNAIARNVAIADRHLAAILDFSTPIFSEEITTIDVIALWHSLIGQIELPSEEIRISLAADSTHLKSSRRVLLRLLAAGLDNAIKHGAKPIYLSTFRSATHFVFEIEDSGAGIKVEERSRVMRAFERGEQSRTTPGTGLGLALATQLAPQIGGQVTLDQQQRGLIYRVEVPIL
jgi:two-component system, OmpR family, osmolarity sensor histidine kinase EnvZ